MRRCFSADPPGRIPFRIRIGVAGHRDLQDEERLAEIVREHVGAIWDGQLGLSNDGSTPIKLAVVSALAEGADRLIVREVFAEARSRGDEARLEAILPMERDAFAMDQGFSGSVLDEYHELLQKATSISELTDGKGPSRYRHAGQSIVKRCDIILVLWSGNPSGGEGGSAETLIYAAARWRPCIWISTTEDHRIRHNLDPGTATDFLEEVRLRASVDHERAEIGEPPERPPDSVLETVAETYRWLNEFNEESLPVDFSVRLEKELRSPAVDVRWVAAPYLRATLLATRFQQWFIRATWTMAGLATLIAGTLAVGVGLRVGPAPVWAWLKLGLIATLLSVFLYTHSHLHLHKRWLSYRLLAERLRSARYLAATGVNFPRVAGLGSVFAEQQSANWVQRAFEEVWDSKPKAADPNTRKEAAALKSWVADDWISRQIDYHREAADRHHRKERLFAHIITALFVLTLASVLARAIPETLGNAPDTLNRTTIFFSILLPAAGASLGAILTVRQHRALAERFHRMQAELGEVRGRVLEADSDSLQRASADAARVIAEESGDWFGAMWFLDIEHPP